MLTRRGAGFAAGVAGLMAAIPAISRSDTDSRPARKMKVLSIDGGGIRGIAAAVTLKRLDEELYEAGSLRVIDCFDVFCGTSTGAIIAGGLALSKTRQADYWDPARIEAIYRDKGESIFGPRPSSWPNDLSRQHWDHRGLNAALREVFGDTTMSELPGNLIVPFYNMRANTGKSAILAMGGPIGRSGSLYGDVRVQEVVQASASAPTYFNPLEIAGGNLGVDGGVFANNPALAGWIATRRLFPQSDALVVSIGCGDRVQRYPNRGTWGPAEWFDPRDGVPLIDVLMRGQSDLVESQLDFLLGRDEGHFRYQFSISDLSVPARRGPGGRGPAGRPATGELDDARPENLAALCDLAEASAATPRATKSRQTLIRMLIALEREGTRA